MLTFSRRRRRSGPDFIVVEQIGADTLAGILKAASAIAWADGSVGDEERRSLLVFLRKRGILARHGRRSVVADYEAALSRFRGRSLADAVDEISDLRRLAGKPGASLVASAALHVALADGVAWPQETALLSLINDRLGLRAEAGVTPAWL